MDISHEYRRPIFVSLFAQAIVLLATSLILDGGIILRSAAVAALAYWGTLLVVVGRHPTTPTRGDLIWAKAGFPIALCAATIAFQLVLLLRL